MSTPIDLTALKNRQMAAWASGDYAVIGTSAMAAEFASQKAITRFHQPPTVLSAHWSAGNRPHPSTLRQPFMMGIPISDPQAPR